MALRRSVTVLALSAALAAPAAVVAATPSSATTASYARLRITPSAYYPGYYDVIVNGHVHGAPANSTVGIRLKGDDPVFNDDLGVSRTGSSYYGDFSLYTLVWHGTLNEDWEGRDEIFASVSSSTGWRTNTPNVNGYF